MTGNRTSASPFKGMSFRLPGGIDVLVGRQDRPQLSIRQQEVIHG